MLISQLLTKARNKNNYSQLYVSDKVNYSPQVISKWENGLSIPTMDLLVIVLANLYKIDLQSFIDGELIDRNEEYKENFNFENFVDYFISFRMKNNLSPKDIGKALNKSKSYIIRLENKRTIPKADFFITFIKTYKLDIFNAYFGKYDEVLVKKESHLNKRKLLIIGRSSFAIFCIALSTTLFIVLNKKSNSNDDPVYIANNKIIVNNNNFNELPFTLGESKVSSEELHNIDSLEEAKKDISSICDAMEYFKSKEYQKYYSYWGYQQSNDPYNPTYVDTYFKFIDVPNIEGANSAVNFSSLYITYFLSDDFDDIGNVFCFEKTGSIDTAINFGLYIKDNGKYYVLLTNLFDTFTDAEDNFNSFNFRYFILNELSDIAKYDVGHEGNGYFTIVSDTANPYSTVTTTKSDVSVVGSGTIIYKDLDYLASL